ncbi:uncharacterized protein METZ01_LOCUS114981, partial [marine metagenome]
SCGLKNFNPLKAPPSGIGDRYLQILWYLQIFCAKMIGSE